MTGSPAGRRYAEVIGDPIAQSKSPTIHNFWLERLGIDARYSAQRVTADTLADYLRERANDPDWCGCNVTMPLKQEVFGLLDEHELHAEVIGAINTVYRNSVGGLAGMNTDSLGFLEPLRSVLDVHHLFRMARVLGTGGAARAIVNALAVNGFTIVLAGRDEEKAQSLIEDLAGSGNHYTAPLAHFADPTDFPFDDRQGCLDLVVNATPLGMTGNSPLLFDWSHAPPGAIAYDIVTSPVETPFLRDARAAGHRTINGLSMLVGQAAIAFERFFGTAPPREHDAELMELLVR